MALTLGTTGMDSSTQAEVLAAFEAANAETGGHWTLSNDDDADFVLIDMDSLYGPMSWLRLHAAGRKVIGLTAVERSQTEYRLQRPVSADSFAVLLKQIAGDAPAHQVAAAPTVSTPAPTPTDHLPDAQALPQDEAEAAPDDAPAMASMAAITPEPDPEPDLEPDADPEPVNLAPDRPLASWLAGGGLAHRVRLQRGDGAVLLIDTPGKAYHGPATLKPLAPCFEGTLQIEDFTTPDAAAWEVEATGLGAAQPLARLHWLGGLLAGDGDLLPGNDPGGQYRLVKWPQTEREYPKHFRIATVMMKGPSTIDEIVAACGVDRGEVVDFVNANLATGYAELVLPATPDSNVQGKSGGGLFGRMRGR